MFYEEDSNFREKVKSFLDRQNKFKAWYILSCVIFGLIVGFSFGLLLEISPDLSSDTPEYLSPDNPISFVVRSIAGFIAGFIVIPIFLVSFLILVLIFIIAPNYLQDFSEYEMLSGVYFLVCTLLSTFLSSFIVYFTKIRSFLTQRDQTSAIIESHLSSAKTEFRQDSRRKKQHEVTKTKLPQSHSIQEHQPSTIPQRSRPRSKTQKQIILASKPKIADLKECPKCGNNLIVRDGKYGEFWGCKGYPSCKYTENIAKKDARTPRKKKEHFAPPDPQSTAPSRIPFFCQLDNEQHPQTDSGYRCVSCSRMVCSDCFENSKFAGITNCPYCKAKLEKFQ